MRTTGMQLLIVGMFLAANPAAEASVVLTYVEGNWMNPAGGALASVNYVYDVSAGYGSGRQQQILWGNPVTLSGQSGLGFIGVASPARQVDIGVPFDLLQLTHFNNPVQIGSACDALELVVALGFENGTPSAFQFTFQIDETINKPGPPNSDDIITFPDSRPVRVVGINGANYTLQLLGFGRDSCNLQLGFVTPEGLVNSTLLWATLVPEPAMVLLLGMGALALLKTKR
jgi:hypothetical protein